MNVKTALTGHFATRVALCKCPAGVALGAMEVLVCDVVMVGARTVVAEVGICTSCAYDAVGAL